MDIISIINSDKYSKERFYISLEEDKFLFGIISAPNKKDTLAKIFEYRTLYDTLRDLDWKTKSSFKQSMEFVFS